MNTATAAESTRTNAKTTTVLSKDNTFSQKLRLSDKDLKLANDISELLRKKSSSAKDGVVEEDVTTLVTSALLTRLLRAYSHCHHDEDTECNKEGAEGEEGVGDTKTASAASPGEEKGGKKLKIKQLGRMYGRNQYLLTVLGGIGSDLGWCLSSSREQQEQRRDGGDTTATNNDKKGEEGCRTVVDVASQCLALLTDNKDGSSGSTDWNQALLDLFLRYNDHNHHQATVNNEHEDKDTTSKDEETKSTQSSTPSPTEENKPRSKDTQEETNLKKFLSECLTSLQQHTKASAQSDADLTYLYSSLFSDEEEDNEYKNTSAEKEPTRGNSPNSTHLNTIGGPANTLGFSPIKTSNSSSSPMQIEDDDKKEEEDTKDDDPSSSFSSSSLKQEEEKQDLHQKAKLLSSIVSLHRHFLLLLKHDEEDGKDSVNKKEKEGGPVRHHPHYSRRQGIVTMASCIALLHEKNNPPKSRFASPKRDQKEEEEEKEGPEAKRRKITSTLPEKRSSTQSHTQTQQRLSIEDEAIAALSMMVSSANNSSNGGSNAHTPPPTPCTSIKKMDFKKRIVYCANDLLDKIGEKEEVEKVEWGHVEGEMEFICRVLCGYYSLLPSNDADEDGDNDKKGTTTEKKHSEDDKDSEKSNEDYSDKDKEQEEDKPTKKKKNEGEEDGDKLTPTFSSSSSLPHNHKKILSNFNLQSLQHLYNEIASGNLLYRPTEEEEQALMPARSLEDEMEQAKSNDGSNDDVKAIDVSQEKDEAEACDEKSKELDKEKEKSSSSSSCEETSKVSVSLPSWEKMVQFIPYINETQLIAPASSQDCQPLPISCLIQIVIADNKHSISSDKKETRNDTAVANVAIYKREKKSIHNEMMMGHQQQPHSSPSGTSTTATNTTLGQQPSPFPHKFALSPAPSATLSLDSRGANIATQTLSPPPSFVHQHNQQHHQHQSFSPSPIPHPHPTPTPHHLPGSIPKTKTIIPQTAITDKMELHDWTNNLISLASLDKGNVIKPSTRLMLYLDSGDEEIRKLQRKREGGSNKGSNNASGQQQQPLQIIGWRDVIVPILNRILNRLHLKEHEGSGEEDEEVDDKEVDNSTTTTTTTHSVSRENGELTSCYIPNQDDIDILPRALIVLYYHVLESILYNETARLKSASHPRLVQNAVFHKALLSCSCVCLMKATGAGSTGNGDIMDLKSILRVMECTPYEYMKVSESFVRGLQLDSGSSSTANAGGGNIQKYRAGRITGFPVILRRHLRGMEEYILDSMLWMTAAPGNSKSTDEKSFDAGGLCIKQVIRDVMSIKGEWPPKILRPDSQEEIEDEEEPSSTKTTAASTKNSSNSNAKAKHHPEYAFLTYILRKLLTMASHRIATICEYLSIPPQYPVVKQVWITFRYLLRHNIDLLYDRHIDQLLLCSLYGVSKIMKYSPELSFSKIIEVYTMLNKDRLGNKTCQRIIRQIKLHTNDDSTDDAEGESTPKKKKVNKRNGNVIHLYNQIFVPSMKKHLLGSKSLKRAISDLKQCVAEQSARSAIRTVEDAALMADQVSSHRVSKTATGQSTRSPVSTAIDTPTYSGVMLTPNMCAVHSNQSSVRVPGSNIYLSVPSQNTGPGSSPPGQRGRQRKRTATDVLTPKTRALYRFGGANSKDVSLINDTVKSN